jgi:hypothetical protein
MHNVMWRYQPVQTGLSHQSLQTIGAGEAGGFGKMPGILATGTAGQATHEGLDMIAHLKPRRVFAHTCANLVELVVPIVHHEVFHNLASRKSE